MVFNATFNNISAISWRSVLFVEETGVPGENHWPAASYWKTLSHNVLSSIHLAMSRIQDERLAKIIQEQETLRAKRSKEKRKQQEEVKRQQQVKGCFFPKQLFHRSTRRKPLTCCKLLKNLSHNVLSSIHLAMSRIRTHNVSGDRHWFHRQL
jgi:hypothetical protein